MEGESEGWEGGGERERENREDLTVYYLVIYQALLSKGTYSVFRYRLLRSSYISGLRAAALKDAYRLVCDSTFVDCFFLSSPPLV